MPSEFTDDVSELTVPFIFTGHMNKNNQTDRLHPYIQDRMQLTGLVILVSLTSEDGAQSKLKNVVSILA
jgi:hypothetical protein